MWLLNEKQGFLKMFHSTISNMPLSTGRLDLVDKIAENKLPLYLLWGELDAVCPYSNISLITDKVPTVNSFKFLIFFYI